MEGVAEPYPAPAKRLKSLAGTMAPSPGSTAKGKEKMEPELAAAAGEGSSAAVEEEGEGEGETCGICFSDSERSIGGRIDSCDHYFCFVCIMEWAKVESRCPLCKRRFRSIRRPPVDGVFVVERLVDVPVRDQVYHPLGNESVALSDPYAHVSCSICHGSQNEELLLLCDLCDSGSHTYCSGLGTTIPEGDWYCPDCTISRDKHLKSQFDDDHCPQVSFKNVDTTQVPEQSVSIYDIVADEIISNSSRRFSTKDVFEPQSTGCRSLSRNSRHSENQDSGLQTEQSSSVSTVGKPLCGPAKCIETGARTLRTCRNLHDRIQGLRENWNSLRDGSLHFSSNLLCATTNEKRRSLPAGTSPNIPRQGTTTSHINREPTSASAYGSPHISRQQATTSSTNREQTSANVCAKTANIGNSPDIDKAWKMMKIAKATQATQRDSKRDNFLNSPGKRTVVQDAVNYPSKANVLKGTEKLQSGSSTCNGKSRVGKITLGTGSDDRCFTLYQKNNSQSDFKQTPDAHKVTDMQNLQGPRWKGDLARQLVSSGTSTRSIFQESMVNPGSVACPQSCVSTPPSKKLINFSSSNIEGNSEEVNGNKMDGNLSMSNDRANCNSSSNSKSLEKLNLSLPSRERHFDNRKCDLGAHVCGSLMKTNGLADNSSKSEVQSLVKLNLKLLSRHQQLGAVRFKEVARVATHTILAACGLEHSKSSARSFPSPVWLDGRQQTAVLTEAPSVNCGDPSPATHVATPAKVRPSTTALTCAAAPGPPPSPLQRQSPPPDPLHRPNVLVSPPSSHVTPLFAQGRRDPRLPPSSANEKADKRCGSIVERVETIDRFDTCAPVMEPAYPTTNPGEIFLRHDLFLCSDSVTKRKFDRSALRRISLIPRRLIGSASGGRELDVILLRSS
ncbi:hypothetical protein OPV22_010888 [Ensete ventricosum]|uniref:PHD-type domain-containing protein n=1 Tax=Ensete ventricosum TaxID=4639 RepID=A0AAV8RLS6_ENSVE|nr:hypothetical protein OPV22_010888 [Ensete ventricosum]